MFRLRIIFESWKSVLVCGIGAAIGLSSQASNHPLNLPVNFSDRTGLIFQYSSPFKGYNLDSNCMLINELGELVKKWPGRMCKPYLDGSMLSVIDGKLHRLSRSGEILWSRPEHVHHSLDVDSHGVIYALSYDVHSYRGTKVQFDTLLILNSKGELLKQWCAFDHLDKYRKFHTNRQHRLDMNPVPPRKDKFFPDYFNAGPDVTDEYYHANSVYVVRESYPFTDPGAPFKAGQILISFSHFNFVAMLDPKSFEPVWSYHPYDNKVRGGHIHSARLTKEGTLTLFLNGDDWERRPNRLQSRIIEVDPRTKKILFQYPKPLTKDFFSPNMGSVEKLENGSYLITDVAKGGRVFEVNREGKVVWIWLPPLSDMNRPIDLRSATRFLPQEIAPYLKE